MTGASKTFILSAALKMLFLLKQNKKIEIQGIKTFDPCCLYSAYTDGTTVFLKNENSIGLIVKILVEVFSPFSQFSVSSHLYQNVKLQE